MTDELKPCPFCGCECELKEIQFAFDLKQYANHPYNDCILGSLRIVPVSIWNARPLEDTLQKSIDELKEYEQACFVARQKDEKLWVKALMALQEQPKLQKRIDELEIEKENWKAKYIKKIQEWKP